MAALGGDQTPDAVNWANIGPGESPQSNAAQTLTGFDASLTIRATLSAGAYDAGAKTFVAVKNTVDDSSTTPADAAFTDTSVVVGDTLSFRATKGLPGSGTSWSATVTVLVVQTGQTLDTFTVSVSSIP